MKKRHSDFYHLVVMGESPRSLDMRRAREAYEDFVAEYGEEYVQNFDQLVKEACQKRAKSRCVVR